MKWLRELVRHALAQELATVKDDLTRIKRQNYDLIEKVHIMAATQAQLDAGIAGVQSSVDQLGTDMTAAIAALQAKINSGASGTADFSSEVAALTTIANKLNGLDAAALAANPPTTGTGTLVASPTVVSLNATTTPSQVVTFTGAIGSITATSANPGVASVSVAAPWTITEVAPGTANVTFTDSTGNTVTVGVTVT